MNLSPYQKIDSIESTLAAELESLMFDNFDAVHLVRVNGEWQIFLASTEDTSQDFRYGEGDSITESISEAKQHIEAEKTLFGEKNDIQKVKSQMRGEDVAEAKYIPISNSAFVEAAKNVFCSPVDEKVDQERVFIPLMDLDRNIAYINTQKIIMVRDSKTSGDSSNNISFIVLDQKVCIWVVGTAESVIGIINRFKRTGVGILTRVSDQLDEPFLLNPGWG